MFSIERLNIFDKGINLRLNSGGRRIVQAYRMEAFRKFTAYPSIVDIKNHRGEIT